MEYKDSQNCFFVLKRLSSYTAANVGFLLEPLESLSLGVVQDDGEGELYGNVHTEQTECRKTRQNGQLSNSTTGRLLKKCSKWNAFSFITTATPS